VELEEGHAQMENGLHYGQHFQKLQKNAENSSSVTTGNAVLETANATRPT